ncbi:MAG: uncharacterized protein A8A55_0101 [Amphiamblys sp. WSBS2006]|nr:MAG: uncharacterized protein A8A55_0101 [Amphiamblys sp. WSBS2006]
MKQISATVSVVALDKDPEMEEALLGKHISFSVVQPLSIKEARWRNGASYLETKEIELRMENIRAVFAKDEKRKEDAFLTLICTKYDAAHYRTTTKSEIFDCLSKKNTPFLVLVSSPEKDPGKKTHAERIAADFAGVFPNFKAAIPFDSDCWLKIEKQLLDCFFSHISNKIKTTQNKINQINHTSREAFLRFFALKEKIVSLLKTLGQWNAVAGICTELRGTLLEHCPIEECLKETNLVDLLAPTHDTRSFSAIEEHLFAETQNALVHTGDISLLLSNFQKRVVQKTETKHSLDLCRWALRSFSTVLCLLDDQLQPDALLEIGKTATLVKWMCSLGHAEEKDGLWSEMETAMAELSASVFSASKRPNKEAVLRVELAEKHIREHSYGKAQTELEKTPPGTPMEKEVLEKRLLCYTETRKWKEKIKLLVGEWNAESGLGDLLEACEQIDGVCEIETHGLIDAVQENGRLFLKTPFSSHIQLVELSLRKGSCLEEFYLNSTDEMEINPRLLQNEDGVSGLAPGVYTVERIVCSLKKVDFTSEKHGALLDVEHAPIPDGVSFAIPKRVFADTPLVELTVSSRAASLFSFSVDSTEILEKKGCSKYSAEWLRIDQDCATVVLRLAETKEVLTATIKTFHNNTVSFYRHSVSFPCLSFSAKNRYTEKNLLTLVEIKPASRLHIESVSLLDEPEQSFLLDETGDEKTTVVFHTPWAAAGKKIKIKTTVKLLGGGEHTIIFEPKIEPPTVLYETETVGEEHMALGRKESFAVKTQKKKFVPEKGVWVLSPLEETVGVLFRYNKTTWSLLTPHPTSLGDSIRVDLIGMKTGVHPLPLPTIETDSAFHKHRARKITLVNQLDE